MKTAMHLVSKLALTVILVAIAAFCCFGFLASFESPDYLVFRWLYGVMAVACVAAIVTVWVAKSTRG